MESLRAIGRPMCTFIISHLHEVQIISKGLFAVFIWTKKRTQYFSISALKIFESHSRKYLFFWNLILHGLFQIFWYIFFYLFKSNISPGILKEQNWSKNIYSPSGARTNKVYFMTEIEKYFVPFLVKEKTVKFVRY